MHEREHVTRLVPDAARTDEWIRTTTVQFLRLLTLPLVYIGAEGVGTSGRIRTGTLTLVAWNAEPLTPHLHVSLS